VSSVFSLQHGTLPLLISVPHDGRYLPGDVDRRMTPAGRAIPDTDWHVTELYDFARNMGASLLRANYSRYVIDLNRSAADDVLYPGQLVTGLCPEKTFAGAAIYADGGVTEEERMARVERYWRPYHQQIESALTSIRNLHGYALLWDAHSIPSSVPRLFDGTLPELNIGTNGGASCAHRLQDAVVEVARQAPYSVALNERFRGGYITRHYGDPQNGVHALQLEIAQRADMDEVERRLDAGKVRTLRDWLRRMLGAFVDAASGKA
jgi:N-formylglutamate amidohydrolase